MNLWRVAIDEKTGRTLAEPQPVTTPARYLEHIALSRDGSRLVYVDQTQDVQIYKVSFDPVAEAVTGRPEAITKGSKPHWFPDTSPDGMWLAFCSVSKPEDIFVIRTDGTGLRQLTDDSFVDRFPRWSPDNRRIAFMSDRSGQYEIWLINADGSDMHRLTYTSGTGDTVVAGPTWSPDGKRIAYNRSGKDPCIIEVDTPWKDQQPVPIPVQHRWVRTWSPDGRRLGVNGGVAYDLASRTIIDLKQTGQPVWLRDSRRLIMESGSDLKLVDSVTGRSKVLLSFESKNIETRSSVAPDNRTIYFTATSTEADIWLATLK
jgi:Tol biopolymer transport system component